MRMPGKTTRTCLAGLHPGFSPTALRNYISQQARQQASFLIKEVVSDQHVLHREHAGFY